MRNFPSLKTPFYYEGKIDKPILVLYLAINLLVLINNILHHPVIGYDAKENLKYIRSLPYRLPDDTDTREFFSAPLPYFLPSLIDKACLNWSESKISPGVIDNCMVLSGKSAQALNVILSLGVTYFVIKIAGFVRPGRRYLKISALLMLGVMTVYYKTFSQVRGEPYLLFFTIWAIYLIVRLTYSREHVTWAYGISPGIILGFMLLSRQWGFMLLPAIAGLWALIILIDKSNRWRFTSSLFVCAIVAFLMCGWFYLSLYVRYGSMFAFNKSPLTFSFSNQPVSFYRHTGLQEFRLFKYPTRDTFNNQLFPIFYSEIWGDYWGYFVFIQDRSILGQMGYGNKELVTPYLGRVNAVSLLPSLILFAGIVSASLTSLKVISKDAEEKNRSIYCTFLLLFIFASLLLYLYFLVVYPIPDQGDTIKATYLLHAMVVLSLLGGEFLDGVLARNPRIYYFILILLGLVFAHNLPAMITRHWVFLS